MTKGPLSSASGSNVLTSRSGKMHKRYWARRFGTVERRQKKSSLRNCAKLSTEAIADFAANTSIHGVKYLLEPRRHFLERSMWVASVAICTAAAAILINISLQKFYNNPTLTSIYSFKNETRKMPFPSITFCNVNLIFRYRIHSFVKSLKIPKHINITRDRLADLLPNIALVLRPSLGVSEKDINDLPILHEIFEANNVSIMVALKSLSQPCHDMVERCSWDGVVAQCSHLFLKSPTYRSYCCTFNFQEHLEWRSHPDKNPYKLRSERHGAGSGLRVLLNPMVMEYTWGSYIASGFSVSVHRSGIISEGPWTFISPGSETNLRLSLDFTDTDRMLKTVQVKRRKCVFFDERPMESTNLYSREACVLECRAKAVMASCNCVPFYYIKPGVDHDTPINKTGTPCNVKHIQCLREIIRIIELENTIQKCNCLSQCSILSYEIGKTESNFDAVEHFVGNFYMGMNTTGRASVNIFLGSDSATLTKVNIIYTFQQLMSKLGGICSLLLGCSFLTAMEVIYYALLRFALVCCCSSNKNSPSSLVQSR